MNSSKLKNKATKKEGTNIKEKFTWEQPGYINVAGEVFFLDLNDDQNKAPSLTKLLFDPSVKGMNAFRILYLDYGTNQFTEEERQKLVLLYRTLFGVNKGKKIRLPCDQKEQELLMKSLLLRRSKLIQQMNNWNQQISSDDIHLRTLRDQLYALNDLILNEIPNSLQPCADIHPSSALGKSRLPLDDRRMKQLLDIFAYLLAQGKDPLELFETKVPNPVDILPRMAKKDAPILTDYEQEYKANHEGKDPIYTETLQQIKYILTNKSNLPKTNNEEEFIKLLEDIEKTIPDQSLQGPTPLTGNLDDRKLRIIKKIKELLTEIAKHIQRSRECESKLEYSNTFYECMKKLTADVEKLEGVFNDFESVLGKGKATKQDLEKILKENKTVKDEIEQLKKALAEANQRRDLSEDDMNIDSVISLPDSTVNTNEDPEFLDTLRKLNEEMEGIGKEYDIDLENVPDVLERVKIILQLLRNVLPELQNRTTQLEQLQDEYNKLQDDANAMIQQLLNDKASLLQVLDEQQTTLDEIQEKYDHLTDENQKLDSEKTQLTSTNQQLDAENKRLQDENQNLITNTTTLEDERNKIAKSNAELEAQLKALNDQISNLQAENQRLQSQIDNLPPPSNDADKERVEALTKENQQLRDQIEANEKQITLLQTTLAGLEAQIKQLQEDLFNTQLERDEANEKRDTAEANFITIQGLHETAEQQLDEIQEELNGKNQLLQSIRTLMVRKSGQLTNPILREENEDDVSFYTRILDSLVPDSRNGTFEEILKALGIQIDPTWNLDDKKRTILQTIRQLIQQKTGVARLFESLNERTRIRREESDTDIQFYEKILKAMPQEDCGPFLDQLKIRLSNQGFQGDLTNQEKVNDLLNSIDAKRIELDNLRNRTNRFIAYMNSLLNRLGLPGNLEENPSITTIERVLQTIDQKVDTYKAIQDVGHHALCLLSFFWNLLKNVFRDYESTFQKVAEQNLAVPDSILEILQKSIVTLQQNGPPTEVSPRQYPDIESLRKLYPEVQTLVRNATIDGGFTEEHRSVAAFLLAFFFPNLPNGNAINLQANGELRLEPTNNDTQRVDLGILFLFLLTYTHRFLAMHADILREAGCDVGIQLRAIEERPNPPAEDDDEAKKKADDDAKKKADDDEAKKKADDDEAKKKADEEQKKKNDVVPPPPAPPVWRPLTTTCPFPKRKVLTFNPNLVGDSPYYITTAQESILQNYPFCLKIDVTRKGSGEKIAYSLKDLNKRMTQSVVEALGENPPPQVIGNYSSLRKGIEIGYDKNRKLFAQVSAAAAGGGTRKRNMKAKKTAKTKKLHN